MQAMLLSRLGEVADDGAALDARELPMPKPAAGQALIEVSCCGVCHTELGEIEGRTPPHLPISISAAAPGPRCCRWPPSFATQARRLFVVRP
jgi:propanol-preferring alcohol dehydrogenase